MFGWVSTMIARLTAVHFERFMTTGRTSPALCNCEDHAGAGVGEYVVKLRGGIGEGGLLNELFAANFRRTSAWQRQNQP
jgi:hypothetical protein